MTSAHSPRAKPWKTAAYLIKQQVPVHCWQLWFCKLIRALTPRHDFLAAINPVETVTPPLLGTPTVPEWAELADYHSTAILVFKGERVPGCQHKQGLNQSYFGAKKTARTFELSVPGGQ